MTKQFLLVLDAGGTFLKAGLFDGYTPVPDSLCSHPANSDGNTGEVHTAYTEILSQMKERAQTLDGIISGVCVDIPGPFDYRQGISHMTHKYTAIHGISLRPWFAEILGNIPVLFLHDSSAFILGAADPFPTGSRIAGAMIGTGLGFALMIDGKVCTTDKGAPLVSIYRNPYRGGIAEDYVSARGIVNAYNREAAAPLASAKEIGILADAGNPLARRVYEDMGSDLGMIVRNILKENEIEVFYVGGQISRSYPVFGDALKAALGSVSSLRLIAPAKNPDLTHLIGAARFWFAHMKNFPTENHLF